MDSRRIVTLQGSLAGIGVTLAAPLIEVWFACRRPISEGCVWGKALLPVNFVCTALVLGVPTFLLVRWALRSR